jgi:membrane-bound metal-dependent hydrolase YbcI (DUF457 family)
VFLFCIVSAVLPWPVVPMWPVLVPLLLPTHITKENPRYCRCSPSQVALLIPPLGVTYYVSRMLLNWYSARKPDLSLRHSVGGLTVVPAAAPLRYHPFVNVVELVPGAVPPETLNSQSRPQYINRYLCDLKLMVPPGAVLPLGLAVVPVMREFVHNGQNL